MAGPEAEVELPLEFTLNASDEQVERIHLDFQGCLPTDGGPPRKPELHEGFEYGHG